MQMLVRRSVTLVSIHHKRMDESQLKGLREKREAAGHGRVMAVSSDVVGNKELIIGLKDVSACEP